MGDLNRIAFMLIAFAVFVLCEIFVRPPRSMVRIARAAKKWAWYLLSIAVVAALVLAAILYAAAAHYSTDPLAVLARPAIFRHAAVVLHVFLAVAFGWFIHKFYNTVFAGETPASGLIMVVQAVPILLIGIIGLFSTELRGLADQIARIETPYGIVDFSRRTQEEGWVLNKGGSEATTSNFQEGARTAREAIRTTQSDLHNIAWFCGIAPQVDCLSPPKQAARQRTLSVVGEEAATAPDFAAAMAKSMAKTYAYANGLASLMGCLREYSEFFENGVPIQDEISEIAANYSLARQPAARGAAYAEGGSLVQNADAASDVGLAHGSDQKSEAEVQKQITQLIIDEAGSIVRAALAEQDGIDQGQLEARIAAAKTAAKLVAVERLQQLLPVDQEANIRAAMTTLIDYLRRYATSEQNTNKDSECHRLNTAGYILALRQNVLSTGVTLPHRYLLQAALLTSAGYPEEGLGHLEDAYGVLNDLFEAKGQGNGQMDFVEFVFRLRLLAEMGRLSEHLATQGKRKYESKKLFFLGQTHHLTRQWLDKQLDLHTNEPTEFMRQCASLTYPDLPTGEQQEETEPEPGSFTGDLRALLAAEGLGLPASGRLAAWKGYVSGLIWYYIHMNFDLFSTVAWQDGSGIEDIYLLESQEWWRVATEEPHLIENCFSAIDYYTDQTYSLLRIMMTYHFGLLHAQGGVKLQQAVLLSSARSGATYFSAGSERQQAERLVCAGAVGLRKAIDLGEQLKNMEIRNEISKEAMLTPTIELWMNQARTILTSVAQQRIDCS